MSKASANSAAGVKVCPVVIGGKVFWRFNL
jgi:hypothetical protein